MADTMYRYLVEVKVDGTILVHPEIPAELEDADRVATAPDIVASSLKLAHDIDQQIVVDRVTGAVSSLAESLLQALVPAPEATVPDQLRDALKERGITPDK